MTKVIKKVVTGIMQRTIPNSEQRLTFLSLLFSSPSVTISFLDKRAFD